MNTIENNKIIAEFMEYEWFEVNKPYIAVRDANGSIQHFQTDWNDLMKVVEKLYNTKGSYNLHKNIEDAFIYKVDSSRIEAVYNACLDFIKWYNEQNK
jgi:hypothetical protein